MKPCNIISSSVLNFDELSLIKVSEICESISEDELQNYHIVAKPVK